MSDDTATLILLSFAFEINDLRLIILPDAPGYWTSAPKKSLEKLNSSALPITSSIPIGIDLVFKTEIV